MIENSSQQTLSQNSASKTSKHKRTSLIAGLILFSLLLMGGVIAMWLSFQGQDTRNQASVSTGLIKVFLKPSSDCAAGQKCVADLYVNTNGNNIDALQLKITPQNPNDLQTVSFQDLLSEPIVLEKTSGTALDASTKKSEGRCIYRPGETRPLNEVLRLCTVDSDCPSAMICDTTPIATSPKQILKLQKNDLSEDKSIMLAWTLSDVKRPFNVSDNVMIGSITLIPNIDSKTVVFNFDPTVSKATLYKTGQDSLNTPDPLTVNVTNSTVTPTVTPVDPKLQYCTTDEDCLDGYSCYRPPAPKCPEGAYCTQTMSRPYCKKDTEVVVSITRRPLPPVTDTPVVTVTPTPIVRVSITRQPLPPVTDTPVVTVTPTPIVRVSMPPVCTPIMPICKSGQVVIKAVSDKSPCPIYSCQDSSSCEYNYSDWSLCRASVQTRTLTSKPTANCIVRPPELSRSCDNQCNSNRDCPAGESCQPDKNQLSKEAPHYVCQVVTSSRTDLNGDGAVNILDLSIVLKHLFTNNIQADVNKDRVVDIIDYSLVLKDMRESFGRIWDNSLGLHQKSLPAESIKY